MARGGKRRRHAPAILTPEQVRQAAEWVSSGKSRKWVYLTLGVTRSTLWRALAAETTSYRGILPAPVLGRQGRHRAV